MDPFNAFEEDQNTQEQIKKMCIEYAKTYFEHTQAEAVLKYIGENEINLKFYIDDQGIPKFEIID